MVLSETFSSAFENATKPATTPAGPIKDLPMPAKTVSTDAREVLVRLLASFTELTCRLNFSNEEAPSNARLFIASISRAIAFIEVLKRSLISASVVSLAINHLSSRHGGLHLEAHHCCVPTS